AFRTGHEFLTDIAHNAAPHPGLVPDSNTTIGVFGVDAQDPGTYDDELLDRHLVTGDGRGNENIALSAMHTIFHAEHNRLRNDIDRLINTPGFLTPAEVAAWHSVHAGSGWGYGERLFQAARFVTEMEYQHLVFEEFARKMQPRINPFLGGITDINPAIKAEFAHTVYRLGHSMLPEVIARLNADGTANDIRLRDAFLNPVAFNETGTGVQSAPQAVGSLVRGLSRQVGNELDEFIVDAVRNSLVGLPLDLAAINLARGRSEGIPSLNSARRQFFNATNDSSVAPYPNWFEFGLNLKHAESLVNFVAAYGTDPSITGATTLAAKRDAARQLVAANGPFMFAPAATSGLDTVDFWIGGLAERQAVFGGLLGSTFNFVFEKQLEDLQNGDRFYYLQRLDGLNLRDQLESNSLAELARRNSDVGGTMDNVFETADFNLDVASFTGTAPVDLGSGTQLLTLADGTKFFSDPQHRGFNIMFNGTSGNDRMRGDVGDDTFYGGAGNDRIEGGEGNDTLLGGDGDDVLFGGPGDDVLKGGTGHDALASGPGFGGDILLGGDGNDFLLGGDDGVEHFGGPGDDVVVDGAQRAEAIFGGPGDDWIYAGDGHDGGIFGDDGNVFDLLAGLSQIGGDDVLDGGPGQDNHFGEGGDDIFLMNEGTNRYFGDFGFDWITQRGWPVPADIELDLLALPATPINFNDLRNKYRMVDGASGWDLDDHIRGDSRTNDPAAPIELFNLPGTELTAGTPPVAEPAVGPAAAFGQSNFRGGSGAAKIAGLTDLIINGFGKTFPFNAGNILLGGGGRDLIEGKGGDDLIDGDSWLNVQLRAVMNDGTVKLVDSPVDLVDDVFADPQRLNPGNISIIRSIVRGAPAVDTAVFTGPRADYAVTLNGNGTVTVVHTAGAGFGTGNDGTDTLRNIELLQFSDGTIVAPGADVRVVPNVVGMTQAAATTAITGAGLTVGAVTTAFSDTMPAGRVISSTPAAGSVELPGAPVALVVSRGSNDVTPPTVSIASPAAGATVSGTVDVTATAADNVGVGGVQFLL
ncbi:MAG: heme peroxidase, partial [Acidobacteria bacterium]